MRPARTWLTNWSANSSFITLFVAGGMAELALFASVDGGYWPILLSAGYASGVASATAGLPAEASSVVKEGIGGAFAVGAGLAIATAAAIVAWIPRHRIASDDELTTESLEAFEVGELTLSAGD